MNIIARSAIAGSSTLLSALALQKLYKTTKIYPPDPVFYFFIGVSAHLAWELADELGMAKKFMQSAHDKALLNNA